MTWDIENFLHHLSGRTDETNDSLVSNAFSRECVTFLDSFPNFLSFREGLTK